MRPGSGLRLQETWQWASRAIGVWKVRLTEETLIDICRGAAFLGTGGGGDPYIGRQMVLQAMEDGHQVDIIDPS